MKKKNKKLKKQRTITAIICLIFIIAPLVYYEICLHDPYNLMRFTIFVFCYDLYLSIVLSIIITIHDDVCNDNIGSINYDDYD